MSPVAIALSSGILGGLGLAFGGLIALVHRRFHVFEDPRIDVLAGMLPGTNCGACGQAGCRAFAQGLVDGEIQPAECTVMGDDEVADVAEYLGVDVGSVDRRVARLLCAGGCDVAPRSAEYIGLATCSAAAEVGGGGKACSWGCLGLADCEASCDFDAIYMNDQELPVVVPARCTACGDCVDACPKDLFALMPVDHHLIVQCRNLLEGAQAESVCAVACNGCGKCAVDAESGVITMRRGLAVINYEEHERATVAAAARCPTGAIVWVEGRQFDRTARSPRREAALV